MKPVQAQFVERRGPSTPMGGLVLAGLLAAAWMQYQVHAASIEQQAQRQHAEQLADEAAAAAARTPKTPLPYEEGLKEIERLRELPWPQLLAALEVVPRSNLQINSIEVDVVTRRADVAVSAADMKAVLDYVESLSAGFGPGDFAWRWSTWRVTERAGGGVSAELRATFGRE
jgi:hypothetical protein